MSKPSFVKIDELSAYWETTTDNLEVRRAKTLLSLASAKLRQIAHNNGSDIDVKIAEDAGGVFTDCVKLVIMAAVKRAMLTPSDAPPADSWSQSASPYSETIKFTNPSNDLFFKRNELQLLGLASVSGHSQFGILRGIR